MNSFMKKMMEDKGMAQAQEIVRLEMRQWEGTITDKGLIQFLSNGYLCKNMENCPVGFTFFMI
jgi:hypothetical protein